MRAYYTLAFFEYSLLVSDALRPHLFPSSTEDEPMEDSDLTLLDLEGDYAALLYLDASKGLLPEYAGTFDQA